MKLAWSTISLLVSAFLTISAAPFEQNIPALESASPEGVLSVVVVDYVGIRAETDANKTSGFRTETIKSSEDAEGAGEASKYNEGNLFPHHCMRSVPHYARNFHHHPCASASASASTTTVMVPIPPPTPAPEPIIVPVPVPYPVPAPEPIPAPAPVPVPVPVPAPATEPKPVPVPVPCTNASAVAGGMADVD